MTTSSEPASPHLSPILAWGFGLAALGIVLGAFGAHAIAPHISDKALETYRTGQAYHMYGAFGLLALGMIDTLRPGKAWRLCAASMAVGILIFSGSLYLLAVTGVRWLGAITPIGGLFQIGSWIGACVSAAQLGKSPKQS